jgi:hypothetical protein
VFFAVVGVLEIKLKQKFEEDNCALAVGRKSPVLLEEISPFKSKSKTKQKKQDNGLLPQLDHQRPMSFEKEREQLINLMDFPSPARHLIQKQVHLTKVEREKKLSNLPPVAGAFKKRGAPHSLFPNAYQRGELPIMLESKAGGKTIRWTKSIKELDFFKYFPLFIEGMRERTFPYTFLAREGAFQLLHFGASHPEKVIDCLHRVVAALRSCLETREFKNLRDALLILQMLARIEGIGARLVPYYRQLLPILNMFKNKRRNIGDVMDFQQNKAKDLGEMILETLEILERTGGSDAYINIKYMVPTYESVANKL